MRVSSRTVWFSFIVLLAGFMIGLAQPGLAAAAGVPGPGDPALTPQTAPDTTASALTQTAGPAADAAPPGAWTAADLPQPVDAFADPTFWAVLGLVVLGHFVLQAGFQQNS
jgi:hypothetical protein